MSGIKAKITTGYGSGGSGRQLLKDIIPLKTPLCVCIFPIYACNFKCKFCVCSLPIEESGYNFKTNVMSFELFKKCVDDMKGFPAKVKMLRFVGVGEPLLNKDIVRMVEYASKAAVADKIEIITNGSLLTPNMVDALVKAGLTQLRISIEGLDNATYEEVTGVKISFQQIVDNVRYLYEHRGNIHVNVKVVDYNVRTEQQKQQFYEIFGSICDSLAIENLIEAASTVDYSDMRDKITTKTLRGHEIDDVNVCPQPYYMMNICPDGRVVPCCSQEAAPAMGNCEEENLVDIWCGAVYRKFRLRMLEGTSNVGGICELCTSYKTNMFPEDKIYPEDAQRLKKII